MDAKFPKEKWEIQVPTLQDYIPTHGSGPIMMVR